ncbi:hypothetical protein BCR34DRAFT_584994 [Clohesyomyces aquaticus]|uniref:Uncharacterized protein n=1 Tax=Clohesyomyces aquaticus TaxID=1231657 RepID=A0A1Y1ZZG5_9PLEO|nr:hypothetical protein BCR34DRAFT_584994 [Clohesyomyces aquaticus]
MPVRTSQVMRPHRPLTVLDRPTAPMARWLSHETACRFPPVWDWNGRDTGETDVGRRGEVSMTVGHDCCGRSTAASGEPAADSHGSWPSAWGIFQHGADKAVAVFDARPVGACCSLLELPLVPSKRFPFAAHHTTSPPTQPARHLGMACAHLPRTTPPVH